MALGPIDYSQAGQVRPVQAADFLGGLQAGVGLGEVAVVREQELQAQQAAQIKQQQDAARQAEIRAATIQFAKNPTVQEGTRLAALYPEMGEHFRKTIDVLEPQEKQARITQMSTALAAAQAARKKGEPPSAASGYLRQQAVAYRNSEREEDAKSLENFATLVDSNPNEAEATMIFALSGALGPEQAAKAFETYSSTGAAVEKTQAETSKISAEADIKREEVKFVEREKLASIALTNAQKSLAYAQAKNLADRLAFDRDKLAVDSAAALAKLEQEAGKVSGDTFKAGADATTRAAAAKQSATSASTLALRFRQAVATGGVAGSAAEWAKRFAGMDDDVSALRRQYDDLVARNVIDSLPPGTASDTDIALVRSGFPSSTASTETVAKFLESLSRVQQDLAQAASDESEFVWRNGNVGPAKSDLNINGVIVPAGTSYNQFSQQRGEQRRAAASVQSATPQQRAAFSR